MLATLLLTLTLPHLLNVLAMFMLAIGAVVTHGKGKTRTQKSAPATPADESKADAKERAIATSASALASFLRNAGFSPADESFVRTSLNEIHSLQVAMVESVFAIGDKLRTLYARIGADKFATLTKTVLPTMGISRSSAYHWLDSTAKVSEIIPNPTVRQAIFALTGSSRNIFTTRDENGKVKVNPDFARAVKQVGKIPAGTLNAEESETYAHQLLKEYAKREPMAPGVKMQRAFDGIKKRFAGFLKAYGTDASIRLVGVLDNMVNEASKTIEGSVKGAATQTAVKAATAAASKPKDAAAA